MKEKSLSDFALSASQPIMQNLAEDATTSPLVFLISLFDSNITVKNVYVRVVIREPDQSRKCCENAKKEYRMQKSSVPD